MVAYSFNRRFVDPILAGTKRQTIRAERKRHVRPGETMQLYTAMRTKQCRLIGRAECEDIKPIRIEVEAGRIFFAASGVRYTKGIDLDFFARLDGFSDWADMQAFWISEHPDTPVFSGILIRWSALQ